MNSTLLAYSQYAFSDFTYNVSCTPDREGLATPNIWLKSAINDIEISVKQRESLKVYLNRMDQPHLSMPKRFRCLIMAVEDFNRARKQKHDPFLVVQAYMDSIET